MYELINIRDLGNGYFEWIIASPSGEPIRQKRYRRGLSKEGARAMAINWCRERNEELERTRVEFGKPRAGSKGSRAHLDKLMRQHHAYLVARGLVDQNEPYVDRNTIVKGKKK